MISTTAELEDLIDTTVTIPTIPTMLAEMSRIVASPDGSARDAATLIERDPAIAAKVLRLVNSSFYGLSSPVSGINLACSILGLKVIRNVVIQTTVLDTFETGPQLEEFDPQWLWDHCFKAAMAARLLVSRSAIRFGLTKDDAYTCGLIHDVGKMILLRSQADRFAEALQLSRRSGIALAQAEGQVFGFSHAHVGGLLAQRWKLADVVQSAVMYHHSPGTSPEAWTLGFLIKVANTVAHLATENPGGYHGDLADQDAMSAMQIKDGTLADIVAEVKLASSRQR